MVKKLLKVDTSELSTPTTVSTDGAQKHKFIDLITDGNSIIPKVTGYSTQSTLLTLTKVLKKEVKKSSDGNIQQSCTNFAATCL